MKNRTETGQSFKQGSLGKLPRDDVRYWKKRLKKRSYKSKGSRVEVKEWQIRLFSAGAEEWFNLGTQNQAKAAQKARDIYINLRANAMEDTVKKFNFKPVKKTDISTILALNMA